jgi:hypothetical protein
MEARSPMHVEIKARETLQRRITVDQAGDLVTWSFFTRRKNIAFGIYYLLSSNVEISSSEKLRIIEDSRDKVSIYPLPAPKQGHGAASGSSSQSEIKRRPSVARSEPMRSDQAISVTVNNGTDDVQSCYEQSNASNSLPDLQIKDYTLSKSPSALSVNSSTPSLMKKNIVSKFKP